MKNKITDKILFLQYAAHIITILVLVVTNMINRTLWVILLLSALLFFSFFIRNTVTYTLKDKKYSMLLLFFNTILSLAVIRLDKGMAGAVFLYILISEIILHYRYLYSFLFSAASLICYLLLLRFSMLPSEPLAYFFEAVSSSIQFIIVCAFLYLLRYILMQNDRVQDALTKLTGKTLEQEVISLELKEAYRELEETTVLRERNKLAREIHDTLGHTLISVLVELEAGKVLLEKDKEVGLTKLELATEQLRKGMEDLRSSVYLLSRGDELVDFKTAIKEFVEETIKHTGVIIEYQMNDVDEIDTSIRKTLFRAVQEGITNGIKHGKSTVFVLKIAKKNGMIEFLLQDNGVGCPAIVMGFGLKSMQERIKEVSGTMKLVSEQSEGFRIAITIPEKKGD